MTRITHHSQSWINNELLPNHMAQETAKSEATTNNKTPDNVYPAIRTVIKIVRPVQSALFAETLKLSLYCRLQ